MIGIEDEEVSKKWKHLKKRKVIQKIEKEKPIDVWLKEIAFSLDTLKGNLQKIIEEKEEFIDSIENKQRTDEYLEDDILNLNSAYDLLEEAKALIWCSVDYHSTRNNRGNKRRKK